MHSGYEYLEGHPTTTDGIGSVTAVASTTTAAPDAPDAPAGSTAVVSTAGITDCEYDSV